MWIDSTIARFAIFFIPFLCRFICGMARSVFFVAGVRAIAIILLLGVRFACYIFIIPVYSSSQVTKLKSIVVR